MDSEQIVVESAASTEMGLLANLLELYIHDLSAIFSVPLGPDGRFGYPRLPLYWTEPASRFPFIIRVDGKAAGFALVTRGSPVSPDVDVLDVAEFFVLRRYRRNGIGRRAALRLFDRFRHRWMVRVCEANPDAIAFWRSVVGDYTGGRFELTRRESSAHSWLDLSFSSGPVERR